MRDRDTINLDAEREEDEWVPLTSGQILFMDIVWRFLVFSGVVFFTWALGLWILIPGLIVVLLKPIQEYFIRRDNGYDSNL